MSARIAVFVSGRGSNLQALWQAAHDAPKEYPYTIAAVCSDSPCPAWDFAKARTIPTYRIDANDRILKNGGHRQAEDTVLNNVDLIVLAGFMRILKADFLADWSEKILNIHPALLPKFPGLDTHRRALDAGEHRHGCTVHFVDKGIDSGSIFAQAALNIASDDTPEHLAARVLELEHRLYCRCVASVVKVQRVLPHGRKNCH